MALSDAAVSSLPFGDRAYDDLDYCWDQWEGAVRDVLVDLPGPEDEDAELYWFIAFVGNLAWAATVFFPPAATIGVVAAAGNTVKIAAGTSRASQAVSLLGAAVGSGGVPKLNQFLHSGKAPPQLNSPEGKALLRRIITERVDKLKVAYQDPLGLGPKRLDQPPDLWCG